MRSRPLYKQLGLGEEPHYFLAYRYLHPWFNLAILSPTVEIFLTKIALVMVTPDELLIRNLGNGMTFTSEHHRDLRQGLIRIPKSEMKEFEIRNWKRAFVFGDFLTIKTSQHSYYLQVRDDGLQRKSFHKHFSDLKRQDFLGLLTDKGHFDRQLPQNGISECSTIPKTTQYPFQFDCVQDWNDSVVLFRS